MDKEKRSFNMNHPELEEGEMFLTNIQMGDLFQYTRIGGVTKRKGKMAYTIEGVNIEADVPVFVQRKEYEEGMKKYE